MSADCVTIYSSCRAEERSDVRRAKLKERSNLRQAKLEERSDVRQWRNEPFKNSTSINSLLLAAHPALRNQQKDVHHWVASHHGH
jgi:hypothetical protein